MPFVRTSRDKRGYEHIYLIDTTTNKRGRAHASRVLYWFRTPPGVKVGREPFDDATRRTLEAQYPSLIFDWKMLANTPMPPPDTEHWRERRRLERSAKQARAAEEREDEALAAGEAAALAAASPAPETEDVQPAPDVGQVEDPPLVDVVDVAAMHAEPAAADGTPAPELTPIAAAVQTGADAPVAGQAPDGRPLEPRRRRRRGGRRRRRPQGSVGSQPASVAAPEIDPTADPDSSTLDPHEEE